MLINCCLLALYANQFSCMSCCVKKSKKLVKDVMSLWVIRIDSIGSIIKTSLCYGDFNQSKTVVQMKQQKIFCCDQISYIVVIVKLGGFLHFFNEHGMH